MATILAFSDGSLYAPSICHHAAWAALRMGSSVHVVHAYQGGELSAEGTQGAANGEEILRQAGNLLSEAGVTEVATSRRQGQLLDLIPELEQPADLVVMGKRGRSANFAVGTLGSHLEKVIRTASRPVLVASRAFEPIERMLFAYDGSPAARKALDYLVTQPLTKGLWCLLVMSGRPEEPQDQALGEARDALVRAGYQVMARYLPGVAEVVIAETVREESIDLLVMGAYSHSTLRQFFAGSTTSTLMRTCRIPILMFR